VGSLGVSLDNTETGPNDLEETLKKKMNRTCSSPTFNTAFAKNVNFYRFNLKPIETKLYGDHFSEATDGSPQFCKLDFRKDAIRVGRDSKKSNDKLA
jgi:hypothetical protein